MTDENRPDALAQAQRDYAMSRRWQAIAVLEHHWGDAYLICWEAGQYIASRRDDGATFRADTAELLRQEIRADYEARPVGR